MMDVLGVSHAIFGADRPDAAIDFFAARGYRIAGRNRQLANPRQRARHVSGPMQPTADVTLLLSPHPVPAIEIIHEPGPPDTAGIHPGFTWMTAAAPGPGELQPPPPGDAASGFAAGDVPPGDLRSFAVAIQCSDADRVLDLWRLLGIEPARLAEGLLRVDVRRSLVGSSLSLYYYVVQPRPAGETWLNQRGLVCIGLFCRNVGALRERLAAGGFDTGEAFELAPFGQKLRVFIARSRSGELFEFVSVGARAA